MEERARQALVQYLAEREAKAQAQRERQKEAKRKARAQGAPVRPKYRFDVKLGRFVEILARESQPRKLEIDGELVSWQELAGKYSAPCMRKAAEVWGAARREYGIDREEAAAFAEKRFYDEEAKHFYTFPELVKAYAAAKRTEEEAKAAWAARGLRFPPAAPGGGDAFERGERERIGASRTGLVGGREPRPRKPAPEPRRGSFTTRPAQEARENEPVEEQIFDVPRRRPRRVAFRKKSPSPEAQPVWPSPPTTPGGSVEFPAATSGRRGASKAPSPTGFEWESPPLTPGGSLAEPYSSTERYTTVEGFKTPVEEISPARQGAKTPIFQSLGSPLPDFSSAGLKPDVDIAILQAIPWQVRGILNGAWRFDEGVRVPWFDLVVGTEEPEYRARSIAEEDNSLLAQLYYGGWAPRSIDDFFTAKVTDRGLLTLKRDPLRSAPYAFLAFVEGFWKTYKDLYIEELMKRKGYKPSLSAPPVGTHDSLPEFAIQRLAATNPRVKVFSPEFWSRPAASRESEADFWIRKYNFGQAVARDWIGSMLAE